MLILFSHYGFATSSQFTDVTLLPIAKYFYFTIGYQKNLTIVYIIYQTLYKLQDLQKDRLHKSSGFLADFMYRKTQNNL